MENEDGAESFPYNIIDEMYNWGQVREYETFSVK